MSRVVYVGGYGRSGSTILDIVLGNHPDVLGAGEAERFFFDLADDGSCSCGSPYADCPIWGKTMVDLLPVVAGRDPADLARRLRAAESTRGLLAPRSRRKARLSEAVRIWRTFFESTSTHHGGTHIIDSSKSSRASSRRILLLSRHVGLDVVVVHLIRDPRAVAYSERRRGNNDELEEHRKPRSFRGGVWRPLAGWAMANAAVSLTGRLVPSLPVVQVRYEDLVNDPEGEIRRICDRIELDPAPILEVLATGAVLDPGHGIRGNRMRRAVVTGVTSDEAWIAQKDRGIRFAAMLLHPIASRYGYDLLRWPRS